MTTTAGDRTPSTPGRRSVQPGAGLSDNVGRQVPLAEDLAEQFRLQAPGVGPALMHLATLRNWGVKVTPQVAKSCLAHYAEQEKRISEATAKYVAARSKPRASGPPYPWSDRPLPDAPPLSGGRVSLVYYAQIGDRVKIGFTTNLGERMTSIMPERLLAVEPGDPKLERARHKQFADLRTRGEWFRHEGPLREHIATLADDSRPDDLLDSKTAAVAFGVRGDTIRKWVQRGRLVPVAKGPNGKHLYRRGDVEDLHARLLDAE